MLSRVDQVVSGNVAAAGSTSRFTHIGQSIFAAPDVHGVMRHPPGQGTRKQKPRLFFETEKQRFSFVFVYVAEGKQEGLWEGSGHSGQGAVGGHAGTRHE